VRALKFLLTFWLAACCSFAAESATAKVIKVLPQYLDRDGRYAVSPSLFDRDAYQAHLRRHLQDRSGIQFAVQWKAPHPTALKLRIELRGARQKEPTTAVLEQPVQRRKLFSTWTRLKLAGEDYLKFGELIAWRATLWSGAQQVAEQKSFLWQ